MSLATQYLAALDSVFLQRVTQAMITAAVAISSELTTTLNHTFRVALAKAVITSNGGAGSINPWSYAFAQALTSQAVDGTATDAAISSMISGVWNAVAGVS